MRVEAPSPADPEIRFRGSSGGVLTSPARHLFRCKICLDAIGEAADVVAFDVRPGAWPDGDYEGRKVVLTRAARRVGTRSSAAPRP